MGPGALGLSQQSCPYLMCAADSRPRSHQQQLSRWPVMLASLKWLVIGIKDISQYLCPPLMRTLILNAVPEQAEYRRNPFHPLRERRFQATIDRKSFDAANVALQKVPMLQIIKSVHHRYGQVLTVKPLPRKLSPDLRVVPRLSLLEIGLRYSLQPRKQAEMESMRRGKPPNPKMSVQKKS